MSAFLLRFPQGSTQLSPRPALIGQRASTAAGSITATIASGSVTAVLGGQRATSNSGTLVASGGDSTGPSAPADFFVTLQGQSAQGSSTFRTNGSEPSYNVPDQPNWISLGWPNAAPGSSPLDHYEIQRSSDNGSTWTTPTGGSSIGLGAADAQGTRFKDTGCTNCVSSVYAPVAGQYLVHNSYLHRLRAVDTAGGVSPWVTGANQYMFNGLTGGKSTTGGFKWGGDLSGGYTVNKAVTDATYGYVMTIDMSAAGSGYFLPTTGGNYCTFNEDISSCDYMYIVLKSTGASNAIGLHSEVVGDLPMQPGGAPAGNLDFQNNVLIVKYIQGTYAANTIQTYKIPLNQFMIPQSGWHGSATSVGVQQKNFYKPLLQSQSACVVTVIKWWFGK